MCGPVPILQLALFFALLSLLCAFILVRHAFRRSVGTGLMVLLIPAYILFYAFSQFEHRRKNIVVAAFFASTVLAALFLGVGAHLIQMAAQPPAGPSPF